MSEVSDKIRETVFYIETGESFIGDILLDGDDDVVEFINGEIEWLQEHEDKCSSLIIGELKIIKFFVEGHRENAKALAEE